MEIVWAGHACFRLKGSALTIVTDPFDDPLGERLGVPIADVVTLSHDGPHPGYQEGVQGVRKVIRGPGEYEISEVFIVGIKTFRDDQRGALLGANTIYRIEIESVNICHLGELGHVPTSDHISAIGDVDVVLIPVGEGSTLDTPLAAETVSLLQPKIIIPMHYATDAAASQPIERLLKELGLKEVTPVPKFIASPSTIPRETQVVLLDPVHPLGASSS